MMASMGSTSATGVTTYRQAAFYLGGPVTSLHLSWQFIVLSDNVFDVGSTYVVTGARL
jgi:hypothetical protein